MNNGMQLRLSDLIYEVRKRWKLIVLLTLLGLVLGVAASAVQYLQGSMSRNYRVTASAVFITESKEGTYQEKLTYPLYNDYLLAEEMTESVIYILNSNRVLNDVLTKTNLTGVKTTDIKNNLQIKREGETPVVELTLNWRSSDEGIRIMTALLTDATPVIRDTLGRGKLSIIDQPSARRVVGGGVAAPLWGILLLLGFWLGIGIVVLNLLMRPKLINLDDVPLELGLETLGVISKDNEYFNSDEDILTRGLRSKIRQQFASTAYILMNRMGTKKKTHVVFLTSAIRREGRTSVASNLAVQIAATEKKVLIIDFDTQNPEVGREFLPSVEMEHSLNGLYRGDIEEHEAIVHINGYLDILPMIRELNPVPMDKSTFDLIEKIIGMYDYVIIDAPPVGVASDALSLNQIADAAIMVVGFDMATKMDIRSAVEKLDKSGCPILGCIINQEESLEGLTELERNSKNRNRRTAAQDENSLAKNMMSGSGNRNAKKTGVESTMSYQIMTETFGKREEHGHDREILDELIEFGLNEDGTKNTDTGITEVKPVENDEQEKSSSE